MGLDNGFVLRNRKNPRQTMELFSFRKYYELAEFFRHTPMLPNTDGTDSESYEYAVDEQILNKLKAEIEPIYQELIKIRPNTLAMYDDKGYPKKYYEMFYGNDFDVTSSQSAFAGQKLVRLYQRIDSMLEILENLSYSYRDSDEKPDFEIILYDSY